MIVLTGMSSMAIAASLATTNDYVWTIIEDTDLWQEQSCHYEQEFDYFDDYQRCLYDVREQRDNSLSQQWGIDNKVIREKDTIYISIPNRLRPLAFKDNFGQPEDDYSSSYSLQRYDKERRILYLDQSLYESSSSTIVDLKSGFWQTFYAENITMSSDGHYIAGFISEPGIIEDISIWKLETTGYYKGYYTKDYDSYEDADIFAAKKKFYQADKARQVYNSQTITWTSNNEFDVDFFYQLNPKDSAAFRVRYTFKYNSSNNEWQLLQGSY